MPIYKDTPLNLVLSTINTLNPSDRLLSLDNALIQSITDSSEEGRNTEITFRAKNLRGYSGTQTFHHNRLDLATLFLNIDLIIDVPAKTRLHQALANINVRYGLNFTTDDIVDGQIVDGFGFTLEAKPDSLQYKGSVRGLYWNAGYRLADVVYDRNLPELNHPLTHVDISLGFKSGAMLGYGIDFTMDANILENVVDGPLDSGVNVTNGSTTALMQTMSSYGFPTWVATGAVANTYPASIVTNANAKYDRVLVISSLTDPAMKGPIYLHYNQI